MYLLFTGIRHAELAEPALLLTRSVKIIAVINLTLIIIFYP